MKPGKVSAMQELVRSCERVWARGGGTKHGLSSNDLQASMIETGGLSGILTYEPKEYTFSAYAGTPLKEVETALAAQGQFLPCEPPWPEAGATLGGSVAAGLSGPSSYLYGGIRDYLLGIEMVAVDGELIRAGGRVVKNAAGFDLSKLVVGSLGMYGVLTSLTFKVFPKPEQRIFRIECADLDDALRLVGRLGASPLEIAAVELEPAAANGYAVEVILTGRAKVLDTQGKRLVEIVGGNGQLLEPMVDTAAWSQQQREFTWAPEDWALVKVPLTPKQAARLEDILAPENADRRYSMGVNLAWVAWPGRMADLDQKLKGLHLSGLVVRGDGGPRVGELIGAGMARRVREALDPQRKFVLGELYLGYPQDSAGEPREGSLQST